MVNDNLKLTKEFHIGYLDGYIEAIKDISTFTSLSYQQLLSNVTESVSRKLDIINTDLWVDISKISALMEENHAKN